MGIEFHNKFHRHSHHTELIGSDVNSLHDPIASENSPFIGNFYASDDIHVNENIIMNDYLTLSGDMATLSAAEGHEGIIRFALSGDILSGVDNLALTPQDIGDVMEDGFGSHRIVGSSNLELHTDVEITTSEYEDVLVYSSSLAKWTPSADFIINPYLRATDAQAYGETSIGADEVWVSPNQLHEVLDRSFEILATNNLNASGTDGTIQLLHREADYVNGHYGPSYWDLNGLEVRSRQA